MNRSGYSILEAIIAMSIFAIGILALSHSYFGIMRAQVNARHQELATQCARDRMEEIVNCLSYSQITEANFPDEGYGEVDGGSLMYQKFSRDVEIVDTLNQSGVSVMKEISITVAWETSDGTRNLTLNSVVAKYKDIKP